MYDKVQLAYIENRGLFVQMLFYVDDPDALLSIYVDDEKYVSVSPRILWQYIKETTPSNFPYTTSPPDAADKIFNIKWYPPYPLPILRNIRLTAEVPQPGKTFKIYGYQIGIIEIYDIQEFVKSLAEITSPSEIILHKKKNVFNKYAQLIYDKESR